MISGISSPFFRRKLTVFALLLFFSSVFLPWLVENYVVVVAEMRFPLRRVNAHFAYWSFMVHRVQPPERMGYVELYGDEWLFFQDFWLRPPNPSLPYPSLQGLYLGWLLVFIVQVWMVVLCFSYKLKWTWLLRGFEATAIVASASFASIVGFCQIIIHHELFTAWGRIMEFPLGWTISSASSVMLTVSYWKSPEFQQTKSFFSSMKRSWKLSLAVILILASVSLLVNEFQYQTGVTKNMIVGKRGLTVPADPKLWENDFKTITTIASLFRAKVKYNSPEYLYCELEAPVISYRVLMVIYNSIGFVTREPTFMLLH